MRKAGLTRPADARQPRLLPQERREVEADEIVERTPRLLRVDEVLGNMARILDRLADRIASDLVEHYAIHVFAFERAEFLQKFGEVPRDRFALAIGVSCEIQRVRLLRTGDRLHVLSFLSRI